MKISSYCNCLFYSTCFLAWPTTFYILPQHCLSFTRHHKMTRFLSDPFYPSLPYSIDILLYNLTGSGIVYIKVNQFSSRLWTVVQFSRVRQLVVCTVCRIYRIVQLGPWQKYWPWIAIGGLPTHKLNQIKDNFTLIFDKLYDQKRKKGTSSSSLALYWGWIKVLLLQAKCVLHKLQQNTRGTW